jgi:TadE-like protein
MKPVISVNTTLRSTKGQSLIELSLITPLMLFLVFGVIEVGSVISTYLTLTHTTREGANLTSRGTKPDDALTAIIAAAAPTIRNDNLAQWKIIYTKISPAPAPAPPCVKAPCDYVVEEQLTQGSLGEDSELGAVGTTVNPKLLALDDVAPNQTFHAIEVFYDYGPDVKTFVGNNINKLFYDRTVFTNVSAIN